jgi:hypothetical protein
MYIRMHLSSSALKRTCCCRKRPSAQVQSLVPNHLLFKKEFREAGENRIIRSFIICTPLQILLGSWNHKEIRWAGHVVPMGQKWHEEKILVRNIEGKRPLERSRLRWKIIGKVVPVLNSLSTTPWSRVGAWRYGSTVLDLDTRWRWVVSFTPRPGPVKMRLNEIWWEVVDWIHLARIWNNSGLLWTW